LLLRAEVLPLYRKAHTIKAVIRYHDSPEELNLKLLQKVEYVGPLHHNIAGMDFALDHLAIVKVHKAAASGTSIKFES
jgi:hypothetical protein